MRNFVIVTFVIFLAVACKQKSKSTPASKDTSHSTVTSEDGRFSSSAEGNVSIVILDDLKTDLPAGVLIRSEGYAFETSQSEPFQICLIADASSVSEKLTVLAVTNFGTTTEEITIFPNSVLAIATVNSGFQVCFESTLPSATYFVVESSEELTNESFSSPIALAEGILDIAFATNGVFQDQQSSTNFYLTVQSTGKIVYGLHYTNGDTEVKVSRLNTDGTIDTSFGASGSTIIDDVAGVGFDVMNDIALDNNDNVYVLQSGLGEQSDCVLTKLFADGSIDTGWGVGGHFVWDNPSYSSSDNCNKMTIDHTNNKMALVGRTINTTDSFNDGLLLVLDLNSGSLDSGFATGGVLTFGGAGTDEFFYAAAYDANGRIVVTGISTFHFVARYMPDGQADNSFDSDGFLDITSYLGIYQPISVAIDSKQRILVLDWIGGYYKILRILSNSSIDTSFADSGVFFQDRIAPEYYYANSIIIDSADNILVAGGHRPTVAPTTNKAIFRIDETGSLDTEFWFRERLLPEGQCIDLAVYDSYIHCTFVNGIMKIK